MSEEVQFGIKITGDTKDAQASTAAMRQEVDKLTDSSSKLASQYSGLSRSNQAVASSTSSSTDQFKKLDTQLVSLLGRLDPTYKSTMQLDAANDLLHRGLQAGLITHQQYGDALAKLPTAFEDVAAGAEKSAFATAGSTRELIVLGHEAVSGNFSRMPGSLMVLASRTGAVTEGLGALVLAGGAAAVTIGVVAVAAEQGAKEMEEMNRALAMTSDFAGQTRGTLRDLAASISQDSQLTIGQSKDVVTQLAASGKIGAQAFAEVADLVASYADATGQSAEKVTPEIIKLFSDPSKAAMELNSSMHFLSAAEIERIDTLQRTGREVEAQLELADKLKAKLDDQKDQVGILQSVWNSLAKAASSAWDAMMSVGRDDTIQEKIANLQQQIIAADQLAKNVPADQGGSFAENNAWKLRVQLMQLVAQLQGEDEKARAAGAAAAKIDDDNSLARLRNSNSELVKQKQLREDIARLKAAAPGLTGEAAAENQDAIAGLQRRLAASQKKDGPKQDAYPQLSAEIAKYADSISQADDANKKLTQGQQMALSVMERIANGTAKLTDLEKARVSAQLTSMLTEEQAIAIKNRDIEVEEAFNDAVNKGIQNQIDAEQAAYEEDKRSLDARDNAYANWVTSIAQQNEDLNTSLITSDKARALRQIELEHQRQQDRISSELAGDDRLQEILDQEDDRYQKSLEKWKQDYDGTFVQGAKTAMDKYLDEVQNTAAQSEKLFSDGFHGAEDAIVDFVTKGKINLGDFFQQIEADFVRMELRKNVETPLMNWFDGLDLSGMFGTNHTGGIAGLETTSMRRAPFSSFAGAPRYHTGGVAGDEVPSILKRGEGVFTEEQMKKLAPAGGGSNVTVNLVESPNNGGQVSQRQDSNGGLTVDVMVAQITNKMSKQIQRGGGLAPVLEGQYGLNRAAGARNG